MTSWDGIGTGRVRSTGAVARAAHTGVHSLDEREVLDGVFRKKAHSVSHLLGCAGFVFRGGSNLSVAIYMY